MQRRPSVHLRERRRYDTDRRGSRTVLPEGAGGLGIGDWGIGGIGASELPKGESKNVPGRRKSPPESPE